MSDGDRSERLNSVEPAQCGAPCPRLEHVGAPSLTSITSCPADARCRACAEPLNLVGYLTVAHPIMWCTPSVLPDQSIVEEMLHADVSSSWSGPGSLLHHTGAFARTEHLLAQVHGADRAFPTPEGSSGGNRILIWALARRDPQGFVLVDRNAHKSIISALVTTGLPFAFLPPNQHAPRFDCGLPPTPESIAQALKRHQRVSAVVLTSPTYSGVLADLHRIVEITRHLAPEAVIHVDSAWGAHLPFHDDLEKDTAMAAGADASVISTHKQAGSLQQGAVLIWNEERLPSRLVHRAIHDQVTTSPSCLIVASIDAATRSLVASPEKVSDVVARAKRVKRLLVEMLDRPEFLDDHLQGEHHGRYLRVDPTKVSLALSSYDISGFDLARELERRSIVVEKASPNAILLLATFRLTERDVDTTATTIAEILSAKLRPREWRKPMLEDPFGALNSEPVVPPADVARYAERCSSIVSLDEAVGRVGAERIETYPPGIPVVLEGFVVTRAAANYLRSVRDAGGRITGGDPGMELVRVIEPGRLAREAKAATAG